MDGLLQKEQNAHMYHERRVLSGLLSAKVSWSWCAGSYIYYQGEAEEQRELKGHLVVFTVQAEKGPRAPTPRPRVSRQKFNFMRTRSRKS